MNADLIAASLELAAERCGDPAPLVYARLFAERPDLEALFIRDRSGLVRGQMLAVAIEALLDFAGDNAYAANLLGSERVNHEGLGVPPEAFDRFFHTLMTVVHEQLCADWTDAMETAWAATIAGLTAQESYTGP